MLNLINPKKSTFVSSIKITSNIFIWEKSPSDLNFKSQVRFKGGKTKIIEKFEECVGKACNNNKATAINLNPQQDIIKSTPITNVSAKNTSNKENACLPKKQEEITPNIAEQQTRMEMSSVADQIPEGTKPGYYGLLNLKNYFKNETKSNSNTNVVVTSEKTSEENNQEPPIKEEIKNQGNNNSTENTTTVEKKLLPTESQLLAEAEKKGLVEYATVGSFGKNGLPRLTQTGHQIYATTQAKLERKENTREDSVEEPFESSLVIGGLHVDPESDTVIIKPIQGHPMFGNRNTSDNTVKCFTMGTHDQGNTFYHDVKTSEKLSNTDLEGNTSKTDKGGQFIKPVIPPLIVKEEDFIENLEYKAKIEKDPKAINILKSMKDMTDQYEPKEYTPEGITREDLVEILEIFDKQSTRANIPEDIDINKKDED